MDVLYSVRADDDVAYADEWRQWVADGRGRVALTITRAGDSAHDHVHGRMSAADLAPFLGSAPGACCFVCGPPGFVDDLVRALSHLGVPADRIRREGW
jgi:ferredoxin-NADP reductase